jgi:hypothetical protein
MLYSEHVDVLVVSSYKDIKHLPQLSFCLPDGPGLQICERLGILSDVSKILCIVFVNQCYNFVYHIEGRLGHHNRFEFSSPYFRTKNLLDPFRTD